MSSNYGVWCLSHQPALPVDDWSDHGTPDHALAAARQHHPECDLLIGRYSGALIDLGCPAGIRHGGSWHPHHHEWVQVRWARLLLAAVTVDAPPDELASALGEFRGCWTPGRLASLRHVVGGGQHG